MNSHLKECFESRFCDQISKFGQVNSVNISTDSLSGKSKHCGYVQMEYLGDAQRAILELNGLAIEGRNIGVSKANQQKEKLCI